MSDSDFIATTDEKGKAVEYVPKSELEHAQQIGFIIGVIVTVFGLVVLQCLIV